MGRNNKKLLLMIYFALVVGVGVTSFFLLLAVRNNYNASPAAIFPGQHERGPIQKSQQMTFKTFEEQLIAKRLKESEVNWKRGVVARNLIASRENILDSQNPWNFKNRLSIWDFFYPHFDCPHTVERIGKVGDGGKWLCGLNHLAKKKVPCIVYSFGVSNSWSFENVLSRTNCSVYMFDHTIDITKVTLKKKYPDRVFIEKIGLGTSGSVLMYLSWSLRSLSSTMKKYGHHFIDVLKVDVEGAEFSVFQNIGNDFPNGLPFGQLLVELHFWKKSPNLLETHLAWLTNLEDLGLRAFRNEVNLPASYHEKCYGCCEYSFVNAKYDNYLLHASS